MKLGGGGGGRVREVAVRDRVEMMCGWVGGKEGLGQEAT